MSQQSSSNRNQRLSTNSDSSTDSDFRGYHEAAPIRKGGKGRGGREGRAAAEDTESDSDNESLLLQEPDLREPEDQDFGVHYKSHHENVIANIKYVQNQHLLSQNRRKIWGQQWKELYVFFNTPQDQIKPRNRSSFTSSTRSHVPVDDDGVDDDDQTLRSSVGLNAVAGID
eukprot:CAMPEP_0114347568 /NCGR_PEP_ID=MMETSP0101-20121206/14008_1 /TAXON_ID=38822 ORGANISM="Pteridomonas danica, Strain PT" /NCGR_SAMPLE_ID=MMETSP0101 /ASSEMBLY_ACC=CAM_ASM_000211 /LENGTH=170 /DNA_ID=CAMNT_0001484963 /DNA_START=1089 /DNA_END=1601 /DNA_ORIENTATION=+